MYRHPILRPLSMIAATLAGLSLAAMSALAHAQPGNTAPSTALRAQFAQALQNAETGTAATAPDSTALRSHLLYPDLQGVRLLQALKSGKNTPADAQISAYLDAHPDLPVSLDLRRSWLDALAQRQQWHIFLRYFNDTTATDALRCHAWRARIETTESAEPLAAALLDFWRTAPRMPAACVMPFDWLAARGVINAEARAQRARKALTDGNPALARRLARDVPAAQAAALIRWAEMLENPAEALYALAAAPTDAPYSWEGVQAGFARLARRSPRQAAELLPRLGLSRFGEARYGELQRSVALGLAWNRDTEALQWFASLPEAQTDTAAQEWRVRAALWAERYDLAAQWLAKMPAEMAGEQRWMYWRARSLERIGQAEQAKHIFKPLAAQNGYYSVLAAWRLDQPYQPTMRPFVAQQDTLNTLQHNDAIARAKAWHELERATWANREWRRAINDLDDEARVQAAWLAAQWGWTLQAVTTLVTLNIHDMFEISYPDPFAPAVARAARDVGVPGEWIYGVMRQESLFNPNAQSSAQAYGLLQLLLPTAREVAKRNGRPLPQRADLLRPEVNIPLGAAFLRELRERFDGQILPALAGYNAGPGAAKRWLPAQPLEPDVWIENIPYNETRGYVQRVLWHMIVHRWRNTGEPQDAGAWLQVVRVPKP